MLLWIRQAHHEVHGLGLCCIFQELETSPGETRHDNHQRDLSWRDWEVRYLQHICTGREDARFQGFQVLGEWVSQINTLIILLYTGDPWTLDVVNPNLLSLLFGMEISWRLDMAKQLFCSKTPWSLSWQILMLILYTCPQAWRWWTPCVSSRYTTDLLAYSSPPMRCPMLNRGCWSSHGRESRACQMRRRRQLSKTKLNSSKPMACRR